MLQIALFKDILVYCRHRPYILYLTAIEPHLGVLKIILLKSILGVVIVCYHTRASQKTRPEVKVEHLTELKD